MSEPSDLDRIRGKALDRIGRAKRRVFWLIGATAVVEGVLLVVVVLVADLSDRLHLLVMFSALLVYLTLAMCVLALGGYIDLAVQRILKAIELLERGRDADGE